MTNLTGMAYAYIEIKQRLIKHICDSGYQVGRKLPTITTLAEEYNVSRDTAIRAVRELVREGILESRRGVGITVRKIPERGNVKRESVLAIFRNSPFLIDAFHDAFYQALPGWQVFQTSLNDITSDNYCDSFLDAFIQKNPYEVYLLFSVHEKLKRYCERKNLPCVVIGEVEKDLHLPNVCFDEYARYYQAARYLLDKGYDNLAFLQFLRKSPGDFQRTAAICEAYSESRIDDDLRRPLIVDVDELDQKSTEAALSEMLSRAEFPLGVVSGTDTGACWLLQQAHAMGVSIPDDLGIVSSGTSDLPTHVYPQITCLRPDQTKLGFAVARMIRQIVSGYDFDSRHVRIPFTAPYVIERQTTRDAHVNAPIKY